MRRMIFTVFLIALAGASVSSARTWYIKPDGTGDAPFISAGVDSAAPGDTVLIASGWHHEFVDTHMKSGVCLRGETGDPDSVVVEHDPIQCVDVDSTAIIEGFTIEIGYGSPGGDAIASIRCVRGSPTIRNMILRNGTSHEWGGGMYCGDNSSPRVENVTFVRDWANVGGALYCEGNSSPTFVGCRFEECRAWSGGALYCHQSSPVFRECIFFNCWSGMGGAIGCSESSPRLVRCTFFGNSADNGAAGLDCENNSHPILDNTIIAFSNDGAVILCDTTSSATLTCCDIYGNADGDWEGCIADQLGIQGNISADPRFCSPGSDLSISTLSPCAGRPGCTQIGALGVGCHRPWEAWLDESELPPGGSEAGVGEEKPVEELAVGFARAFGGGVELVYSISRPMRVSITVHDIQGQFVRTVLEDEVRAGEHRVVWDGLNASGAWVASGTYFIRVDSVYGVVTRRAVLLR